MVDIALAAGVSQATVSLVLNGVANARIADATRARVQAVASSHRRLRLGADLIARARAGATVWIGDPTWPNHAPIFREAGLTLSRLGLF